MRALISGFEPFGADTINASWEAVKELQEHVEEAEVYTVCLPVEYERSWPCLLEKIEEISPDLVICVGQAAGRALITPEKIGINWKYRKIPDNAGVLCDGAPILSGGAAAYFATNEPERIARCLNEKGIPAEVSFTAGTYVCNNLLYMLMHYIEENHLAMKGGFLHVPCLPEQVVGQANMPSMDRRLICEGIVEAIRVNT